MTPSKSNPPPILPAVLAVLCLGALCAFPEAGRCASSAQARLAAGWEYDSNVLDEPVSATPGGAATASLFSLFRLDFPRTVTQLDYQLGYKAHHRLSDRGDPTAGDILVNRLQVDSERQVGDNLVLGGTAEIKNRSVFRKNPLNLLSEEGYLRGEGELFARRYLEGLGTFTLGWRWSAFDFETFHTFDYRAQSPRLRLTRRLTPALLGSLEYSFTRRSYDRLIAAPDPAGGLVQLDERQRDNLHQVDASVSLGRGYLLTLIYTLQRNGSNNFGFSYWNNRFSLLSGRSLPCGFFFNAYIFFEFKRYSDRTSLPILVDLIMEENNNNGLVLKLSRPLGAGLEASATYSLYRNESPVRELKFRKNLLNLSLNYRL